MLKKLNKKGIALLVASAVLLTAIVGTTIAYLIDVTDTVEDTFTPATVTCTVTKSGEKYVITNTSDVDVYLRVAVVVNATDGTNLVWNSALNPTVAETEAWVKHDNYYYCKTKVSPSTPIDFGTVTESALANYQVQLLAEASQATPDEAVQNAWKMTFNGTSWSVYTKN